MVDFICMGLLELQGTQIEREQDKLSDIEQQQPVGDRK